MEQEELREYVHARLKVFYEEELDVPLVLFDEVLDHVLRIDRIFKQNQVSFRERVEGREGWAEVQRDGGGKRMDGRREGWRDKGR